MHDGNLLNGKNQVADDAGILKKIGPLDTQLSDNYCLINYLGGGISAPQNLHGTFSLLLSFGTICSRPHLGQVRLRCRIVAITVENIRLIGSPFTGFNRIPSKRAIARLS